MYDIVKLHNNSVSA